MFPQIYLGSEHPLRGFFATRGGTWGTWGTCWRVGAGEFRAGAGYTAGNVPHVPHVPHLIYRAGGPPVGGFFRMCPTYPQCALPAKHLFYGVLVARGYIGYIAVGLSIVCAKVDPIRSLNSCQIIGGNVGVPLLAVELDRRQPVTFQAFHHCPGRPFGEPVAGFALFRAG